MPHLYFNKRYWRIAGDDVFMPLSCSITGRILWIVLLTLLIYLDFSLLTPCRTGCILLGFLCFALLLFVIAFIFDVLTMFASIEGTIVESSKRTRKLTYYMHGRIVIGYLQAMCAFLGIIGLAFDDSIPCKATPERSNVNRLIFSVIIFSQFIDVTLLLCCFYCLSLTRIEESEEVHDNPPHDQDDQEEEEQKRELSSPRTHMDDSSTIGQVEETFRQYLRNIQYFSCNLFGGGNINEDLGSIARLVTEFFHHGGFVDIVPSDVIAGILLVRIEQLTFRNTARMQALQDKQNKQHDQSTVSDTVQSEQHHHAYQYPKQYIAILPKGIIKPLETNFLQSSLYAIETLKEYSHVFTYAALIYAQITLVPERSYTSRLCTLCHDCCVCACCFEVLPTGKALRESTKEEIEGKNSKTQPLFPSPSSSSSTAKQNHNSSRCSSSNPQPQIWLCGGYWYGETLPAAPSTTTTTNNASSHVKSSLPNTTTKATNNHPFPMKKEIATLQGMNFYGKNRSSVSFSTLHIENSELIFLSSRNDTIHKPYAIFLDHAAEEVLITIRGSLSIEDCITDMSCDPVEMIDAGEWWGFPGAKKWAHSGMLRAACAIRNEIEMAQILYKIYGKDESTLQQVVTGKRYQRFPFFHASKYAHYKLILTGHSLGAGTASILAMLLYPLYPFLHCIVYGTPGSVFDEQTCIEVIPYVTSIILGNDFIPRLSLRSLCTFRNDILDAIARAKVNKMYIMQSLFRDMTAEEVLFTKGEEPSSHFQEACQQFTQDTEEQLKKLAHTELFLPGKIIHIIKTRVEYTWFGGHRSIFRLLEGSYDEFTAIAVSRSMVSDHFPEQYQRELHRLYRWRVDMQYKQERGHSSRTHIQAPHEVFSPTKDLPDLIRE